MTNPGFLIIFEGGEGGGKTSQIPLLIERLSSAGYDVLTAREPGGTHIGEILRDIALNPKYSEMTDGAEVLLFQAMRAQLYSEVIIPALKAGKVVIMDRSRDSSVVYQGIMRGFGEDLIEDLNDLSTQKTYPNLTLLLDVPFEIGLKRVMSERELDRIEAQDEGFHQRVREAYLKLAKQRPERWVVIDAQNSMDEVAEEVWGVVEKRLSK